MTKATNPQKTREPGRFLHPWGPPVRTERLELPGWEGERPLPSFVLRVLNAQETDTIREHLRYLLRFDFQIFTPDTESAWRAMQRPEVLDYAAESMIKIMRLAADMWIDSGKDSSDPDIDTPADRNVNVELPGCGFSLVRLFENRLFMRFPLYTRMFVDGTQRIKKEWPRFSENDLGLGLKTGLEDYGARMALYYFADLLNSEDSRRIARCDNCKRYFTLKRARLRTVKFGVFCPKCSQKGSVKRTEHSRAKRLQTAAKAWIEWESKPARRIDQREWVWQQVNKAHGTAFGRRWVSQNLTEIEKRVEALRNAKG